MKKKTKNYKITIKELPEEMSKEELEKVKGGLLGALTLPLVKAPKAGWGWSHTACMCRQ